MPPLKLFLPGRSFPLLRLPTIIMMGRKSRDRRNFVAATWRVEEVEASLPAHSDDVMEEAEAPAF